MFGSFFDRDACEVAPDLIGCGFFVFGVGGKIVETEAYNRTDPASHSFGGMSKRNKSMFGPVGVAYVYRIYGLYWCMNLVCSDASAVLLRALMPLDGIGRMKDRRKVDNVLSLCSGPAKLAQALNITNMLDGMPVHAPPFLIKQRDESVQIESGTRIGIRRAIETPWRFWQAGSPYVSGKRSLGGSSRTLVMPKSV